MNMIEQLFNDFGAKYLEEAKKNGVDLGLQTVYTPIDKIEKATNFRFADYITSETRSVGVLFNTEFIGYFIKELPQNYINNIKFTFFYDCKFDYKQVRNFILFSGKKLNIDLVKIENIKDLDKVMASKKFDIVYSNPPYDRSLHLKILKTASESVDFEKNGKVIFVHPNRWLIAVNKDDEKYAWLNNEINKVIAIDLNKIFNIANFTAGIITILGKDGYSVKDVNPLEHRLKFKAGNGKIYDWSIFSKDEKDKIYNIFLKIINNKHFRSIKESERFYNLFNEDGKYYVQHNLIIGNGGFQPKHIYCNGKSLMNDKTIIDNRGKMNQTSKCEFNSVQFNTKEEAENYRQTQFGNFMLFIDAVSRVDAHVHQQFIPFMNDYSEPWTDERFYDFFNISNEERDLVNRLFEKQTSWND